ncbi:MAG: HK97 gp10 family phage protein [Nanoarchaeota archaeon]|nr:HK97 gp10 family phage protein [Nanoarchaeota archaeon]
MINVSVEFNVKNKEIKEKLKKVLFRAMIDMHKIAKQKCPVDTGRLRNSIKLFPSSPGAVKYILAATVEYAGDVEFGTTPHFVSAKELRDWARRKLGDESAAGAVAEKIRRAGTNAHPFMRPALMQVKENKLKESFKRILG